MCTLAEALRKTQLTRDIKSGFEQGALGSKVRALG